MVTESMFPSGWHTVINRIAFRVINEELTVGGADFPTAFDMVRVLTEGFMRFTKMNQRTEAEGRLDMFPSPNGLNVFANGIIMPDIANVNNGVPSSAAVPDWIYPVVVENQTTFEVEVEFNRGIILDANVMLLCELHTSLVQPIV